MIALIELFEFDVILFYTKGAGRQKSEVRMYIKSLLNSRKPHPQGEVRDKRLRQNMRGIDRSTQPLAFSA